ncbi:MAG: TOPRIM nucleotidyl transferase/hydrolase domain-containing protein [Bryobacteraceae bacterium]
MRATAKELFPKQLDERNVSVTSVGGKDNISKLVKLVLKLGIPRRPRAAPCGR